MRSERAWGGTRRGRSRRTSRVVAVAFCVAVFSCSTLITSPSLDETIAKLCAAVDDCVGVNSGFEQDCSDELDDAHRDRRLDHRDLAACAGCVQGNSKTAQGQDSCERLLARRDCDVACENVDLVLRARTTKAQRARGCDAFEAACGPHFAPGACVTDLNDALRQALESGSDLDVHVQACLTCVTPQSDVSVDPAFACRTLIDGCSEHCQPVQAMHARFVWARAELEWCANPPPCTLPPSPGVDAGSRDAGSRDAGSRDAGSRGADVRSGDRHEPSVTRNDAVEATSDASDPGSCDAGNCDAGNCDAGNCDAGNCDAGNCDAGMELECPLVSGPISELCCLHGDALPSSVPLCSSPDVSADVTLESVNTGAPASTADASAAPATTD